jgi:hypothetical protein
MDSEMLAAMLEQIDKRYLEIHSVLVKEMIEDYSERIHGEIQD